MEYLLFATVALLSLGFAILAWWVARGKGPEFGWMFFWIANALPWGVGGVWASVILANGWFEVPNHIMSQDNAGILCAIIVLVCGSYAVSDNIRNAQQGYCGTGLKSDLQPIPRAMIIFAASGAAYFIGLKVGQSLLANSIYGGRMPQHLSRKALTMAVLIVGGCSSIAVVGVWALCFKLWARSGAAAGLSLSGLIGGAAEAASRAKVIIIGLALAAVGGILLVMSVPPLATALNDGGDWGWPAVGSAVGAYFLFAHGLGPIWNALTWSRASTDTHGLARWATLAELRNARLAPLENGLFLGAFAGDGGPRESVCYPGTIHAITIGPNNSGKGTGLIIPNLAILPRSIFIIDPKGEAAAVTARHRAKFGPVKIINPFNVLADELPHLASTGFNPLAALDPTHDNFTDDCVGIAKALVKDQLAGDAFFSGSAQDLITALIMYEKRERGDDATLANVRTMLTEPYAHDASGNAIGLAKTAFAMANGDYAPLSSKAHRFTIRSNSNLDIISTAINETRLLDSPALRRDLGGEAIDWNLMKREITTVYLIIPADRLETHANYLRLVVTSALRSLLRSQPSRTLPPVLFMLDEFAQLGYLSAIENAMGIARGYGVQLWPILQDLNQLHALYKDRWQTFIGARGVLTAFAPQDMFTADYLSKLCGNKTIIVQTENSRADFGSPGTGRGPQGQPLIRPEELMGLPAGQMLCFVNPVKYPFITDAAGYWTMAINEHLDRNPYHPG